MITLQKAKETDIENYIRLQKEVFLVDIKYSDDVAAENDNLRQTRLSMFKEPGRLTYTILTDDTNDFCGYCGIKNIHAYKPEIEIELLKKHRGIGVGFHALCTMMIDIGEQKNISCFTATVEPDNYASQRLMYKLGGVPDGVKKSMFLKEKELAEFEKANLDLLSDNINKVAAAFCAPPQRLLSHDLVFDIALDAVLKARQKHFHAGKNENSEFAENSEFPNDREISIARRKFSHRSFSMKLLKNLLELEKLSDKPDEYKEKLDAYLKEALEELDGEEL